MLRNFFCADHTDADHRTAFLSPARKASVAEPEIQAAPIRI